MIVTDRAVHPRTPPSNRRRLPGRVRGREHSVISRAMKPGPLFDSLAPANGSTGSRRVQSSVDGFWCIRPKSSGTRACRSPSASTQHRPRLWALRRTSPRPAGGRPKAALMRSGAARRWWGWRTEAMLPAGAWVLRSATGWAPAASSACCDSASARPKRARLPAGLWPGLAWRGAVGLRAGSGCPAPGAGARQRNGSRPRRPLHRALAEPAL